MSLIASQVIPSQTILDTLRNAHEGTTQVQKFRIDRICSEYEGCKMKSSESL